MQPSWTEFVGQQLNTLVAIAAMAVIGTLALVLRTDDVTIPMAALTGIAGLAGNLSRAVARSTDAAPTNGTTNGGVVNG